MPVVDCHDKEGGIVQIQWYTNNRTPRRVSNTQLKQQISFPRKVLMYVILIVSKCLTNSSTGRLLKRPSDGRKIRTVTPRLRPRLYNFD